jgi:hypothetical protein
MRCKDVSSSRRPSLDSSWIEREFWTIDLADERLSRRAKIIVNHIAQQPSASIPQACQQWNQIKAAYRFLSNPRIKPTELLQPHLDATLTRMQTHQTVLALQDTTMLNYSRHPNTEGLGPVANNRDKTLGFFLHTTFAVTPQGVPLGVLNADTYSRNAQQFGRSRRSMERNQKSVAEKESQRWIDSLRACQQIAWQCPNTQIVNVADREGDIYELFARSLDGSTGATVHLLIRVQHNRNVEEPTGQLWPHLQQQLPMATMLVKVPRRSTQPERVAKLEVRFCPVKVLAPLLKEDKPALALWAIEAREVGGARISAPILWRLLTTLPVVNAAQGIERVGWYAQRWQIEMLHKVLKSGCHIERRQLETRSALERLLMLDLIVAWRLLHLTKATRHKPEEPGAVHLSQSEWKILWWKFKGDQPMPPQPVGMAQIVRWIAQLGGFIGRKSDGDPGVITLWRGLQRLNDLSDASSVTQSCG